MAAGMRKVTPEGQLTRSIRQLLNTAGIYHWKVYQTLGAVPGCPDILGVYNGRFLGIEVKAPRGIVSPMQQNFIDKINRAGGLAFVARSLEDVIVGLGLEDRFLIREPK